MSRFYAAEATASEKSAAEKETICNECGKHVPIRCPTCTQYIREETNEKRCNTCGQETQKENQDEWEVKEQKDGTMRALCNICKRKLEKCPECERDYDSDDDIESSEEDINEETEGETEEDDDISSTTNDEGDTEPKLKQSGQGRKKYYF